MLNFSMYRKFYKNLNNSVLIVAHLDDEIIFASSLINHVKKIIICFCSNSNEKELTKSRRNLIKNFPNKKFIFLKLEENNALLKKLCHKNLNRRFILHDEKEINYVKTRLENDQDYNQFKRILKNRLLLELESVDNVFTHNEWGEYGHFDHININNIVRELTFKKNINLFCFGYIAERNFYCLKNYLKNINPNESLELNTNKKIFQNFKELYIDNNCWTWYANYELPEKEFFYFIDSTKKGAIKTRNIKYSYINFLAMNKALSFFIKKPLRININNKFDVFIKIFLMRTLKMLTIPLKFLINFKNKN
tara:strand:- start:9746 stop:10666 length:921 start_codon:yes stop_codon:yes gene_type:complete